MRLDEYLFRKKITVKNFAEKLGYNRSWISMVVSGTKKPSIKLAKLIEQETNGKVTASSLLIRGLKNSLKKQTD